MSLIAAYAFDEGQGASAAEASGGPAIAGIPAWATGRHGSGLRVDRVAGPVFTPFSTNTPFTIMFDVFLVGGGNSAYNVIMNDWENQGDSAFGNVQVGPSGNLEWYLGADTTTLIAQGEWRHIALSATGTNRKTHVDGVLAATSSTNTNMSGTGPIVLGGFSGYEPNMIMDNLRVYDAALSDAEIAAVAGTPVVVEAGSENGSFWIWDGASREAINLRGLWNGTDVEPLTYRIHN